MPEACFELLPSAAASPLYCLTLARSGSGFVVQEIWTRLSTIPYYQQRIAAGGKGPPMQVATAVKEIIDKFVTSAERRVGQQHLPKALDPLR
jgi:hypothetical protein